MTEGDDGISKEDRNRAFGLLMRQGVFTQIRLTLTEGVFLVAFAILLGAPNTILGLLAALPAFAQLLQIPSVILVEKYQMRKRLDILTSSANRLAILLMALIPFITTSENGLVLLVIAVGLQASFIAIGSPSWNSWLRELVPREQLGRFFSRRMTLMTAVGIPISLIASLFIDFWVLSNPTTPLIGYSVLFGMAFMGGVCGTWYMSRIPEPKHEATVTQKSIRNLLLTPYNDRNFSNLMAFSFAWTFSTAIAAPFFTVYMLSKLNLAIFVVVIFSVLTQIVSIVFFRFWGRMSDRFSNKSVLQVTVPLFMLGTFLWTFTTLPGYHMFTIPLLVMIHLLTGVASAGVTLTSNNIGLKLAPRGSATTYLAARGVLIAIAGTIAPILGGILADFFSLRELTFAITWTAPEGTIVINTFHLGGLDFLFIISVLLGIYALHRLALVKEEGEVDEKVVLEAIIAETRRNVKTLSTVDGLKHTFQMPLPDRLKRKPKKNPNREKKEGSVEEHGPQ